MRLLVNYRNYSRDNHRSYHNFRCGLTKSTTLSFQTLGRFANPSVFIFSRVKRERLPDGMIRMPRSFNRCQRRFYMESIKFSASCHTMPLFLTSILPYANNLMGRCEFSSCYQCHHHPVQISGRLISD